ncbi:MAG: glycosyltransferase family 39 protein [Bacteroidetes bacterium]|nr:glycosyltransferase family 39 protein [Bacteroidota bacterium]
MPQITYIDTESPRRERRTSAQVRSRTPGRWKSVARWIDAHRIAIIAVMALYRFIGLGTSEMQQWDESIYALRSQVILQFGALWDQSAFMLNGTYYSAHPPLYVWLSTSFLLLFSDHLWVYRFTSAIAGALLVPLLYRFSRMLQPTVRSVAVAGLFAFAPLPVLFSRLGQLDLLLTLCMTAALYFALRTVRFGAATDTLLAGAALGAALMTKLFFALSVPVAVLLAAPLLDGAERNRAFRVSLLMLLISLPLWVPWAWSFAAAHGDGPGFLFSAALPFGATLSGMEGSVKDTGAFYYVNQLIVNISVMLPFALASMWYALFRPRRAGWIASTIMIVLTLMALWMMRSSFEVYLIPIMPLLFLHAVRGVALVRRASRVRLLSFSIAAALCFAWSLAPSWRMAVKSLLRSLGGAPLPSGTLADGALLLSASTAALLTVWWLYRSNRLRGLLSLPLTGTTVLVLAAATCVRIWLIVPAASDDGASAVTAAVRSSNAARVFLIGNGDNPQLTFYLNGADIGWVESEQRRFERLEPHAMGVEGIRARIAAQRGLGPAAVLIERDEIAQGAYENAAEILPPGFQVRLQRGRYIVAGDAGLKLKSVATTQ